MTRPLLRLALRAPIALYDAGLGWLLGDRFLLLVHRGRRTGRPRRAVLEVVRHDVATDTYISAAGWPTADWVLNVARDPCVTIAVGPRRFRAVASGVPFDAAVRELADYARRHPVAFGLISRWMLGAGAGSVPERCHGLAASHPLVAFRRPGPDTVSPDRHRVAWAPTRCVPRGRG
jgi:deazaflavin-dependent oxidoreductase (nitroreductase family)